MKTDDLGGQTRHDMMADPGQFTNLATATEHQATTKRLGALLKTRTVLLSEKEK